MPRDPFVEVEIDGEKLEVDIDEVPVSISYVLEDSQDFQKKKGSAAFDVAVPINNINSKLSNTIHSLIAADTTPDNSLENPQPCVIRSQGYELLVGKAILRGASHAELPDKATWNVYGDNSDWSIDLKDKTLQPYVNSKSVVYNFANVKNSWNFNGRDEQADFVFAPVRYSSAFGSNGGDWEGKDQVVTLFDLRPAISVYWILWRAFNSLGYTLQSKFFDTDYFRKLVMPWVWGSFQRLDNTVYDTYKFSAATPEAERATDDCHLWHVTMNRYVDLKVTNDSVDGMFDNGGVPGVYSYIPTGGRMVWTFPSSATSLIIVGLSVSVFIDWTCTGNSYAEMIAHWFVDGQLVLQDYVDSINAPAIGTRTAIGERTNFFETQVAPGSTVECRLFMKTKDTNVGRCNTDQYVTEFKTDYFKFALNSSFNLQQFNKFQNYKILDLLRGLVDKFDLQFSTDSRKKIVSVEPFNSYILDSSSTKNDGFIILDPVDWTLKQDKSKLSNVELANDYEKEWYFAFKEDSADGALKKMQDRYQSVIGQATYILPDRYQPGKKEVTSRFFSALMHVQAQMFSSVTGVIPQLPCIFPENISNTSAAESENTFGPKLAWYKGNITGVGGWKFLDEDGTVTSYSSLPYMFAVNYQEGGENDPVLSYADQKIGSVIATGLMKRFFWQRLALYRHGRRYKTYFYLTNSDVISSLFRKTIGIGNSQWIITSLENYKPMSEESATATMWQWHPVTQRDVANSFPSADAVLNDTPAPNTNDFKYIRHLILYSDLPK